MKGIITGIKSIVFILIASVSVQAQTCSCAGAPLLGTQSAGANGQGNILIGLTHEFNQITNLYTGTTRLSNNSVERFTLSTLLEINAGLTDRLSLSGTLSFVQKNRESGISNPGGSHVSSASGIGDGVMLLRYVISQQSLWNRFHLAVGAGAKAPLGSTSLRTPAGFHFNADMQPGTGAWDGVFWSMSGISLLPWSEMNLSWINSYRVTGTNERFTENDDYRFGNEYISNLSVSNSLNDRFSYAVNLRYRSTISDQRNEITMPNTDSKVLNNDTGFNRNYNIHVYGNDYSSNHFRVLFPIQNEDSRLNRKDRVHAIIPNNADESSEVKAFFIDDFGNETTIIRESFSLVSDSSLLQDFLIIGNNRLDFINAFRIVNEFEKRLELTPLTDDTMHPAVMTDQHGNYWDIFGYAISGPNAGEQLTDARSYTGYWYALADFYPNIELFRVE